MIPISRLNPESYRQQLHPWCIIRLLPNAQRITVARFRKPNDADAHMRTLRRLIPQASFIILFAPPPMSNKRDNAMHSLRERPMNPSPKRPSTPRTGGFSRNALE